MAQQKQVEWFEQWSLLKDNELFLFEDWIYPNTLESFRGMDVLECGCGGGQHTSFMAPFARSVTAVDLNTVELAKARNKDFGNVSFEEADIATMDLGRRFDVVISIGVVHHTDSPDKTIANLKRHLKPGGRLIVWVYSKEGNFLVAQGLEPIRKLFLKRMNRRILLALSNAITAFLYIPVYSLYKLPFGFLPYYEYFENFRKLSFYRNNINVFDKMNAPQVDFISRERIGEWFNGAEFKDVHISSYKGVGWSGSGVWALDSGTRLPLSPIASESDHG